MELREPDPDPVAGDPGDRDSSAPDPSGTSEREGRRYPSTVGGAFYLLVLITSGVGLGIVSSGNWRLGVKWIAGSLLFAALIRLVLPAREAGMLAVRRRGVDVLLLALVGVVLWFLSTTIPNQPPL